MSDRFENDFTLVHVKVGAPELRFRRIQARDNPRDPQTFDAFIHQDKEEEQDFRSARR